MCFIALNSKFFSGNTFLDPAFEGPPRLIPPDFVISLACHLTLQMKDDHDRTVDVWATVGHGRVSLKILARINFVAQEMQVF
jgi:hypothetical protein